MASTRLDWLHGYDGQCAPIEDEATATAEELFNNHIRYAYRFALKTIDRWRVVDYDERAEIVQCALVGLWRATKNFDAARGKFCRYARYHMSNAIRLDFLAKRRTVAVSDWTVKSNTRVQRLQEEEPIGREQAIEELRKRGYPVSHNTPLLPTVFNSINGGKDREGNAMDMTLYTDIDRSASEDEILGEMSIEKFYGEALAVLPEGRNKEVVKCRLETGDTFEVIGARFNISRQRADQIVKKGLETIREMMICRKGYSLEDVL